MQDSVLRHLTIYGASMSSLLALHEVWYWFSHNRHKPWIAAMKGLYDQLRKIN
jgi:hypothetical protein